MPNPIRMIRWNEASCSIVMENQNAECPLLGIVNLLLLRGTHSLPPDLTSVSTTQLLQFVTDALLSNGPSSTSWSETTLDMAVGVLDKLPTEVLFDVKFTGVSEFSSSSETVLLELLNVPLYHALVIDPTLKNMTSMIGDLSHSQIIKKITSDKTTENLSQAIQAKAMQTFLEMAANEMTSYGLTQLAEELEDRALAVLWKNGKLVTVFKQGGVVYQLITDQTGVDEDVAVDLQDVWKVLAADEKPAVSVDDEKTAVSLADHENLRKDVLLSCSYDENMNMDSNVSDTCPYEHPLRHQPNTQDDQNTEFWNCNQCGMVYLGNAFTRYCCESRESCNYDICGDCRKCKVVLTGLAKSVTKDDISDLFSAFGPIEKVEIVRMGLVEVHFLCSEDALASLKGLNNRLLDGRTMKCQLEEMSFEDKGHVDIKRKIICPHGHFLKPPTSKQQKNESSKRLGNVSCNGCGLVSTGAFKSKWPNFGCNCPFYLCSDCYFDKKGTTPDLIHQKLNGMAQHMVEVCKLSQNDKASEDTNTFNNKISASKKEIILRERKQPLCSAGHVLKKVPTKMRKKEYNCGYGAWICRKCGDESLGNLGSRFRCEYHKVTGLMSPTVVPLPYNNDINLDCEFDLCGKCFLDVKSGKLVKTKGKVESHEGYRKQVIKNVKKILAQHPDGLVQPTFSSEYRKAFGEQLDCDKLGSTDVMTFLGSLGKTVLELSYGHSGTMQNSIVWIIPSKMLIIEMKKKLEVENKGLKLPSVNIPPNISAHGPIESLDSTDSLGAHKQVLLPHGLKEGDSLDVIVTEVTSPSDFWIQLRGAESSWNLEGLMNEMEIFYSNNEGICRLNQTNQLRQCFPGAIMAVPYKVHGYHRGRIEDIIGNFVKVFFLDYGTVDLVKINDLRLLHRKFSKLPAQALEAKLWGLSSPIGVGTWPKESTQRFFDLITEGSKAGGCFSIVKKIRKGVLYLDLYDTVTNDRPEGVNINLELIKEGFACKDTPSISDEKDCVQQIKRLTAKLERNKIKADNIKNEIKAICQEDVDFLASVDDELSGVKCSMTFLQQLILPKNTVQIINFKGMAWMTSAQISQLFPSWQGRDLLDKMVQHQKMCLDIEDITSENSDLYTQLLMAGLTPRKDVLTGEEKFRLYLLNSVPSLINMFSVEKNRPLRLAVMTAIDQFNPGDKFWWFGSAEVKDSPS